MRTSLALARAHLADRNLQTVTRLVRRIFSGHHAAPVPILIEALLLNAQDDALPTDSLQKSADGAAAWRVAHGRQSV
jgi:hypothetical protein